LHILAEAVQSQEADSVSFSAAMSACEKGSCWYFALELLSQMHRHKHRPTFVQYGSLLASCRLGAAWQQAMMVLKLASTSLDAVCLTHVLYTLEAAGHWAGTLPVLWSIRHQLRPQMEFASRATDPAAGRAYAASTGSLEVCESYGYGYRSLQLGILRARVRLAALQELRLCQGWQCGKVNSSVLESLCDLGRPCTQDTLEQLCFDRDVTDVTWHCTASTSLARQLSEVRFASPFQAAANRLGVWTCVQLDRDLPDLNGVEVTLGTHR
jgi:hypothetical protein